MNDAPPTDPTAVAGPDRAAADDPSAGELILMGTGSSVGVPAIGCESDACLSDDPRNDRTRCGVLVRAPGGNFVIDTPPELRIQVTRTRVPMVHAALFTHGHADHIFGLDDLRICSFKLDHPLPLSCEANVETQLRESFAYAFADPAGHSHRFAAPRFEILPLVPGREVTVLGLPVLPLRVMHGKLPILGFRIGDVAYCTDASGLPDETKELLRGLDTLVLGALRHRPHPTHYSVGQAVEVAREIDPRRTFLTHISGELEHVATERELPDDVRLAYDGLRIPYRMHRHP